MFEALIAALIIASLGAIGAFFVGKNGYLFGTNRYIIPVAVGVFLGVVFFELIPETLEMAHEIGSIAIVGGFLAFYLLSHLLHTFHHHHDVREDDHDGCVNKHGASMLLIGDAVHNFSDGIVIATAFLINPVAGIAATVGIAFHEIPQEIAEFGVLLRAGYSKTKAVAYNLLSAGSVVIGVILTSLFAETIESYLWVLTGIAAGNLLFIAASDLIPELQEEHHRSGQFKSSFIATLIGLIAIALLLGTTH